VEDIDSFAEKVDKAGGKQLTATMMPGTGGLFGNGKERSNAEVKFSGPDGVIIDMSESGWQTSP
jgi:predicted enzyme related to lactoylglutathione lyase